MPTEPVTQDYRRSLSLGQLLQGMTKARFYEGLAPLGASEDRRGASGPAPALTYTEEIARWIIHPLYSWPVFPGPRQCLSRGFSASIQAENGEECPAKPRFDPEHEGLKLVL